MKHISVSRSYATCGKARQSMKVTQVTLCQRERGMHICLNSSCFHLISHEFLRSVYHEKASVLNVFAVFEYVFRYYNPIKSVINVHSSFYYGMVLASLKPQRNTAFK